MPTSSILGKVYKLHPINPRSWINQAWNTLIECKFLWWGLESYCKPNILKPDDVVIIVFPTTSVLYTRSTVP